MKVRLLLTTFVALPCLALGADVSGTWKAEFDTQIGIQKYTYTLKQDRATVTGKASSDIGGEKHETDLKDGKIEDNQISFVELLNFQGNEVRIVYTGEISGDEIKFTRGVGDFAKEELVAKRAPSAPPAQENPKAAPKSS